MLTFSLLGILLAIIYVSDGWRSAESGPIFRSPKIRGLGYLLGGGIAATAQTLLYPQGSSQALQTYITAFTLTTLACLVLLVFYGLIVSYRSIKLVFPRQNRREIFMDSLPYAVALH